MLCPRSPRCRPRHHATSSGVVVVVVVSRVMPVLFEGHSLACTSHARHGGRESPTAQGFAAPCSHQ